MIRHILVHHFLENSAIKFSDKVALIHQGKRLTYAEIDSMANRLANALLDNGIERGDRVAIFMDNSIEAVISIFAALKAGAAFMVINHTTKTKKLEHILNNSRAKLMLTQDTRADTVKGINCLHLKTIIMAGSHANGLSSISFKDILNSGKDTRVVSRCIDIDLASIVYTSGSTGCPKGVMLSHLNIISAAHSINTYLENSENDIIINVLPLSFDYGLYQILMGFKVGGTIVLEKSFVYPYQILEMMMKEKVTGFPGIPTIFAILLQMKNIDKYDFSSLRYITNTAAALPVSHINWLKKLFPKAKIYSMYGLTECKRVSFLPPDQLEKRPTSIGKGMPNEEVYIVNGKGEKVGSGEIGELVVRGTNVMLGYWEMPDETAKCLKPGHYPGERILYTGDLFSMDEEGYLYFVRRKDDIIKCHGEKVSPKEIEDVLYGLDGVLEAAVIGIPDSILGQAVKAYVVPDRESKLTKETVSKYCSQHLENFKVPKYVEIMTSLPKTRTGKISKNELASEKLYTFLSENSLKMPDKVAVIYGRRKVTYRELHSKTLKLASFLLARGIQKGDRVGILSENSPEYIISYFGIQKAGGISVDINPQFSAHEVNKILNNCLASFLIVENKFLKLVQESLKEAQSLKTIAVINNQDYTLRPFPVPGEDIRYLTLDEIFTIEDDTTEFPHISGKDIASIIYTSGTTGDPKGVMLSHDNFVSNAKSIINYLHLNSDDRIMVVLPFYYSYGKSLLNTHIAVGGTLVLENSFMYPNVVLDKMVDEDITGFAGVPSTFALLLNRSNIRNYVFPKLRYVTQAGGPMSPKHELELTKVLPDTQIFIMYGQTEASARITYLPPRDLLRKTGSIGKPIPGVEVELIKNNGMPAEEEEEGEIVVKGENVMVGYWNNPEETKKVLKKDKLYTGDIARMDNEGYLYIVGRRSDMIKSGAHRISPKEIEEVILEMDEVHEVAVVGIKDEILGEAIKAIIVLKGGFRIDAKKVQKHCQRKLAHFKIPKEIVFVDELPKTSSGKVRRHLCKELIC